MEAVVLVDAAAGAVGYVAVGERLDGELELLRVLAPRAPMGLGLHGSEKRRGSGVVNRPLVKARRPSGLVPLRADRGLGRRAQRPRR